MLKRFVSISSIMFGLIAGTMFNSLNAQTFTIKNDTSKARAEAGKTIAPKTIVINNSADTLNFYWKRKTSTIPSNWQNPGVCDKNACYNSADSATFSLAPDTSGQLKINFYARDTAFNPVEGKGNITIKVGLLSSGFPNVNPQTSYFEATTSGYVGLPESGIRSSFSLETYPNPVKDQLNLSFRGQSKLRIKVFNVVGKQVIQKVLFNGDGTVNTQNLEDGVYILKYRSNQGNRGVKRFYKE
jgi:hypothetical protein